MEFYDEFRRASLKFFRYYKSLGERALAQLHDDELHLELAPGMNSAGVIVQHLAGNMHSRWADLFGEDGESITRNRDAEFEDAHEPRDALIARWERGWRVLFSALEGLSNADWERPIRIRGEQITVIEAVQRQLAHYPYHVGQIVLIARLRRGTDWESLSIPRGESAAFNAAMFKGKKTRA
jgi:uncharacterized damage-inducible protein DinB